MNENRVWFITGTSSGFGRALAEAALDRGDRLVATARDPGQLGDLGADDDVPENRASAAVAARLGMSHQFDTTGRFGEPVSVYRLVAPEPIERAS